ncbi:MAG TPA: polysaccharide deacetylase family protein [Longimicrobiales bacterium]
MSARSLARGIIEACLVRGGIARAARQARAGDVAILSYHNIVAPADAGYGDASLHLPLPQFLAQVEALSRTHDFIDLDDVGKPHAGRRIRAVITFDDAYRGAVQLALPELIRRGIPAVVFVAPGLLQARSTWWDQLAAADRLTGSQRNHALVNMAGRGEAITAHAFSGGQIPDLPPSYGIASIHELLAGCGSEIAIGSHSWGHEYLPALDESELRRNLEQARAWVAANAPRPCNWLALPYGGGNAEVSRTALDVGHAGVLRIEGGLCGTRFNPGAVPRINVPSGMSERGLVLRASGVIDR